MAGEKLQKVLAATGLGSRRQIEKWIADGRISVNGEVAHVGQRVEAGEPIALDGKSVVTGEIVDTRVIMYNKPLGEICTRSDPQRRPTVFGRLPAVSGRWISVGRLDINTTGLLLLTNDGSLAARLMHPSSGFEREYIVRVRGTPGPEQLEELRRGIALDGRPARFDALEPFEKKKAASNQWYRVVLKEGRNREIRRLWEQVGCSVNQLKRVRFGPVRLPRDLAVGHWRDLGAEVIGTLRREAERTRAS
ncbi:pseudouridine synthase [Pseudomonadota bacterium]